MPNSKLCENLFATLSKKYKRSIRIYVILTISLFVLTATLAILNLFAIRYNPAHETKILSGALKRDMDTQQILFFVIIILSASSALVSGIMTEFTFRKKAKEINNKKKMIYIEIEKYKNKSGDYAEAKRRDKHLINQTTKIINE